MEKNSRTEMLPGKRDFYRCCKARRSASHVNKEFWQQFQNYAQPYYECNKWFILFHILLLSRKMLPFWPGSMVVNDYATQKKITRSRRGIWADIPRYTYREMLL